MKFSVTYIRSHYPKYLGIRKSLQTLKVQRITRHTLPKSVITKCEQSEQARDEIIPFYLDKWADYLRPTVVEAEYVLKNAPKFTGERDNRDKIRSDMIFCRLAYGFIPSEYTAFGFEKKTLEERKEYVSDLDISTFGYTVNDIAEIQKILDKSKMVTKFDQYLGRETMLIQSHADYEQFVEFVKRHPTFVKKKTFSCKGKGVELVKTHELNTSIKEYFEILLNEGTCLLEELVIQSNEMSVFNDTSVNTVRVRTFNTKNGVDLRYCNLRTGRNGSFVDNGGAGGLLIGVDEKTGIINTDGYDEFGEAYSEHPDSQIKFRGYQIPDWNDLIKMCIKGAKENPLMGYLSWDMVHTYNGWKVIEVNEVGQFVGAQLISGRGLKKELEEYKESMKKYIW